MSAGAGEGAANDASIQTEETVTPVEPTTPFGSNPPIVPENLPVPGQDQANPGDQAAQDEELRKRQEAEAQEAQQQEGKMQPNVQPPQTAQPTQVQEVPQSPQSD